jgi:hypothetical protein
MKHADNKRVSQCSAVFRVKKWNAKMLTVLRSLTPDGGEYFN